MKDINLKTVGERIKIQRNNIKMTQAKLAEICDISVSHIAYIEGGRKGLSLETAVRICNALNMSLDYLFLEEITDRKRQFVALEKELISRSSNEIDRFLRIATLLIDNIDKI